MRNSMTRTKHGLNDHHVRRQFIRLMLLLFLHVPIAIASENVVVQVLSEEAETPLRGLTVRIVLLPSRDTLAQQTNSNGRAAFTVTPSTRFELSVSSIRIGNSDTTVLTVPESGVLPVIEVSLSKKALADAAEYVSRAQEQQRKLEDLRRKVDRADVYRTYRAFLDSLIQDEVLTGDTIVFTAQQTGKVLELVADEEGFVYFKGFELGLSAGESYTVTCSQATSTRRGGSNGCPTRVFAYEDSRLDRDWSGNFSYRAIPIGANRLLGLQFQTNSVNFEPTDGLLRELSVLAAVVARKGYNVEIQGHTDNVTTFGDSTQAWMANVSLSQRRAVAVRNFLIKKYKVDPDKVTAKGYGSEFPIADNTTEEGRAFNRRVMIKVKPKRE